MPEPTYLTAEGEAKLKAELEELKGPRRTRIIRAIALRNSDGRSLRERGLSSSQRRSGLPRRPHSGTRTSFAECGDH